MTETRQQVLIAQSDSPSLRDEFNGWSYEDPWLFVPGKHIGATPGARFPLPNTPLEALARGWKLLAPPSEYTETYADGDEQQWEWWFVREAVKR